MKDIYLLFSDPGLQGESQDHEHSGWLEVDGWCQYINQPVTHKSSTSGGHTSERVEHDMLYFTKYLDLASPTLYQRCSSGRTHGEVIVDFMRADTNGKRVKYLQIKMLDVLIGSVLCGARGGIPYELFGLKYAAIEWTYTKQDIGGGSSGVLVGSWSLAKNAPSYSV